MPKYKFDAERFCTNNFGRGLMLPNGEDCFCMIAKEIRALKEELVALLARHNALELTVQNIKVHFDMLCTHELRQHGFVSPDHDIDFQVFRVLCGYKELMESHNALVEAVAWEREIDPFYQWASLDSLSGVALTELIEHMKCTRAEVDRLIANADDCEGEG